MNRTALLMTRRKLSVELAVIAAAALVLAVLGPFGSWAMPIGRRLLVWAVFAFGGYACFRPVIAGGDALAAQSSLPRWAAIAIACLVAALPTTLLVAMVFAGERWRYVSAGSLAATFPQVLIVGATVTAIQLLVRGGMPLAVAEAASAELPPEATSAGDALLEDTLPAPGAKFFALLPAHLGRDLLCIENEDHYVRVHTRVGNALVLMRLRDAIAQLAEIDGAQVHRSWWVARGAVREVVRRDRAISLRLVDGREVPVARTAVAALRAAGWL